MLLTTGMSLAAQLLRAKQGIRHGAGAPFISPVARGGVPPRPHACLRPQNPWKWVPNALPSPKTVMLQQEAPPGSPQHHLHPTPSEKSRAAGRKRGRGELRGVRRRWLQPEESALELIEKLQDLIINLLPRAGCRDVP